VWMCALGVLHQQMEIVDEVVEALDMRAQTRARAMSTMIDRIDRVVVLHEGRV